MSSDDGEPRNKTDPLAVLAVLGSVRPGCALAGPAAAVRYVLADGGIDAGDCTDSRTPCKTIQYALGQAGDEDTIRVGYRASPFTPAVYTGTVFITRSVVLEGSWATVMGGSGLIWQRPACVPAYTTMDGLGAGRAVSIAGTITPPIDCFTITGGDATGLGGDPRPGDENDAGGGIYSRDAAPIIIINVITANTAWLTRTVVLQAGRSLLGGGVCRRGGGIYLLNAPATAVISNNLVANNVADRASCGHGGGIALRDSDAQVVNNTLDHNRASQVEAGYGGGIAVDGGGPAIAGNDLLFNAAGSTVYGCGGGISVLATGRITIESNHLQSNWALSGTGSAGLAGQGGGVCIVSGPASTVATVRDNTFVYNAGGPRWLGEGGGYLSGVVTPSAARGNVFNTNYGSINTDGAGGGMYVADSQVSIVDSQFFHNKGSNAGLFGAGGGIYATGSTVLIQGNAITSNGNIVFAAVPVVGLGGGMAISDSVATVRDNRVENNTALGAEYDGRGGGVYMHATTLHMEGNTVRKNLAPTWCPATGWAVGFTWLKARQPR